MDLIFIGIGWFVVGPALKRMGYNDSDRLVIGIVLYLILMIGV